MCEEVGERIRYVIYMCVCIYIYLCMYIYTHLHLIPIQATSLAYYCVGPLCATKTAQTHRGMGLLRPLTLNWAPRHSHQVHYILYGVFHNITTLIYKGIISSLHLNQVLIKWIKYYTVFESHADVMLSLFLWVYTYTHINIHSKWIFVKYV